MNKTEICLCGGVGRTGKKANNLKSFSRNGNYQMLVIAGVGDKAVSKLELRPWARWQRQNSQMIVGENGIKASFRALWKNVEGAP